MSAEQEPNGMIRLPDNIDALPEGESYWSLRRLLELKTTELDAQLVIAEHQAETDANVAVARIKAELAITKQLLTTGEIDPNTIGSELTIAPTIIIKPILETLEANLNTREVALSSEYIATTPDSTVSWHGLTVPLTTMLALKQDDFGLALTNASQLAVRSLRKADEIGAKGNATMKLSPSPMTTTPSSQQVSPEQIALQLEGANLRSTVLNGIIARLQSGAQIIGCDEIAAGQIIPENPELGFSNLDETALNKYRIAFREMREYMNGTKPWSFDIGDNVIYEQLSATYPPAQATE